MVVKGIKSIISSRHLPNLMVNNYLHLLEVATHPWEEEAHQVVIQAWEVAVLNHKNFLVAMDSHLLEDMGSHKLAAAMVNPKHTLPQVHNT